MTDHELLHLIRCKLHADGVDEDDDEGARRCLARCVMPERLTRVWFAHRAVGR